MANSTTITGIGFLQHRTGDRIKDRYEVLDHLGGGNFGSVYRVHDSAVGNFLACKEMHVMDDPATVQDAVQHLRTLMSHQSLEEVFAELVLETNPEQTARDIADVVAGRA